MMHLKLFLQNLCFPFLGVLLVLSILCIVQGVHIHVVTPVLVTGGLLTPPSTSSHCGQKNMTHNSSM